MHSLDKRAIALECLTLASGAGEPTDTTVARARAYFDFIAGEATKTPRERIEAALDAANIA